MGDRQHAEGFVPPSAAVTFTSIRFGQGFRLDIEVADFAPAFTVTFPGMVT